MSIRCRLARLVSVSAAVSLLREYANEAADVVRGGGPMTRPSSMRLGGRSCARHQSDGATEFARCRRRMRAPSGSGSPPRVRDEETVSWCGCASHMMVPYNRELGVHEQAENLTRQAVLDFASTPPSNYPLLLQYPYVELYRKQAVKQADVTLAMYLRGDAFTAVEKARSFRPAQCVVRRGLRGRVATLHQRSNAAIPAASFRSRLAAPSIGVILAAVLSARSTSRSVNRGSDCSFCAPGAVSSPP